jgi:hypothetical protein
MKIDEIIAQWREKIADGYRPVWTVENGWAWVKSGRLPRDVSDTPSPFNRSK